jgi:hypothetical protein
VVESVALERQVGDILSVEVVDALAHDSFGLLTLSFYGQVGEVLATIDPEANSSLDFKHNGYQNFLNHF